MKSLTQKTKIWCNNALSRKFGRYSFLEGGKLSKIALEKYVKMNLSLVGSKKREIMSSKKSGEELSHRFNNPDQFNVPGCTLWQYSVW